MLVPAFARATIIVLVLAVTIVVSTAAQDTGTGSKRPGVTGVAASQTFDGDYFAAGPRVEISGTVNGDVYAFGGQVMIDGNVNGDIIAAAGTLNFSGSAHDVRVAGGDVTITGEVGRNLTVAGGNVDLGSSASIQGSAVISGGNVEVSAPIGRSAKIAAGNLSLANRVGGDVDAAVGRLRVTSRGDIQGNVIYSSGTEASVSEGARIGGQITWVPRDMTRTGERLLGPFFFAWLLVILTSFVSTLILGLLSARFLPAYHQSAVSSLRARAWQSLTVGFIALVLTPVICALLFAMTITIPLGLILTAAYLILLYFARIIVMSFVGEAILARFQASPSRAWAFVLGLVIYYLLAIIPFVGWITVALTVLFGLGAELMARRDFYRTARTQQMI